MTKKMGIEGVGPKIILSGLIYAIFAYLTSSFFPENFNFAQDISSLNWLILVLGILGIIMWIGSAIQLLISWKKKSLMTTGFYAIFLNPIYNSFILFIFPALSLSLNNWLYLGLSLAFVISMRRLIYEEDEHLIVTYGEEYEKYKDKVIFKF